MRGFLGEVEGEYVRSLRYRIGTRWGIAPDVPPKQRSSRSDMNKLARDTAYLVSYDPQSSEH